MFDLYKPLRNYLRSVALLPSLLTVYRLTQHAQFGTALPPTLRYPMFGLRKPLVAGLHEWTLELLARELILNAPAEAGRAIDTWNAYANVSNLIQGIENRTWGRLPNGSELIRYEMVRMAHRQFPWQLRPDQRLIASYLKLYSSPRLAPLIEKVFGMSADELMQVGMSLSGHFLSDPAIRAPIRNLVNAVDDATVANFVGRFSAELEELRSEMVAAQAYDANWAYVFNPLRNRPMVRLANGMLFCPMPTLLLWRMTEGVYFDLVKEGQEFHGAFGPAFEDLTGEVIAAANKNVTFEILREQRYGTRRRPKDAVDWIVQDQGAALFIECKSSRFKTQAKFDIVNLAAMHGELDRLESFVAQLYTTLADALAGAYPHWKPDGRQVYPLVLTLDDWLPSGRILNEQFEASVRATLSAKGVDPNLVEQHPFTLCSLQEFEVASQVMATQGIGSVMAGKTRPEERSWAMMPFLQHTYPQQKGAADVLFITDWLRV